MSSLAGDMLGGGSSRLRPVRWAELDAQSRAAELYELVGWVRWLVVRYALDHREVPECWYRHGALVEELFALRGAWALAYDVAQSATAAADWHGMLAYARQRLREWASRTGCKYGEHRPDTIEAWASQPDESGWAAAFYVHVDSFADDEAEPQP